MSATILIYLGVYIAILFAFVLLARKKETSEGFLIGGRNRAGWQILLSKVAGSMGAAWFITFTAFAYRFGWGVVGFIPGLAIGYLFFAYWAAPRLYRLAKEGRFYTQGDFVQYRLRDRVSRWVTDIFSMVIQAIWLIGIIVAGAKVMSSYGLLSYELAVVATAVVVLCYILIAGFQAVILTDIFQAIIIVVLVVALGVGVVSGAPLSDVFSASVESLSWTDILGFTLFGALAMFGQSDRYQLIYASKSQKAASDGIGLAFIPIVFTGFFLLGIGMFMKNIAPAIDPARAFTEALVTQLPEVLIPFGVVLLFAGLMSSADTYMYAITSHITFLKKPKNPVRSIRITTLLLVVGVAGTALLFRSIVDLTILAGAVTVPLAIAMMVLIAGVRRQLIFYTTLIGGVVGVVTGLAWFGLDTPTMVTSFVGTIAGLLVGFGVAWKVPSRLGIRKQVSLKNFNTFGVRAYAEYFAEIFSVTDAKEIFQSAIFKNNDHLFLGGGSNVLFTRDFHGLVIKNSLKGILVQHEDEDHVIVCAMSGENWHEVVMYAVERGWGGVENLALIPGTVGAAPVQNIGAYGVELKDVIQRVEAIRLEDGELISFSEEECHFGYRDSIFKNEARGKYFITSITMKLHKNHTPSVEYGAIQKVLAEHGVQNVSIKDVRDAVIKIREEKLPDPVQIGNAGSFFKNPIVQKEQCEKLLGEYSDMPYYELDHGEVKIPAAWLIEQAGWKGKRVGNVGSHERQALVLVNHGEATGEEILDLARDIQNSVQENFGIFLEPEVTII